MRLLMVLLLIVICTPALAAESSAEFPGFQKIAEWKLGSGENELGCRPADPNDPPNVDYLYGCGPMLLSDDIVLDPVNQRLHLIAEKKVIPFPINQSLTLMDAVAGDARNYNDIYTLVKATSGCMLQRFTIDRITLQVALSSIHKLPGTEWGIILSASDSQSSHSHQIVSIGGDKCHRSFFYEEVIDYWEPYRSLPDGQLLIDRRQPTVFCGETMEARMLGCSTLGDVIGINRIIDNEARTLLLLVNKFGIVQDLFELPLVPWPRQVFFQGDQGAFIVFRDNQGSQKTLSPYVSVGNIELYVRCNGKAMIQRDLNETGVSSEVKVFDTSFKMFSSAPLKPEFSAYDPVTDQFVGKLVSDVSHGHLRLPDQWLFTECTGDDGRYHVLSNQGTEAISFGITPEGAVHPFRAWGIQRPVGEEKTFLTNIRVTRTGEVFLDDPIGCRTFRFLPDGSCVDIREGIVEACITERGAYIVGAGDDPSSRPLLEFDLALNFQRKLAKITEPGGRVGTVRVLGLDDRHRLHLIRFRDGQPLQCVYDQETGKLLSEKLLKLDTTNNPHKVTYNLRHDGAVRIFIDKVFQFECNFYPPVK